MKNIFSRPKAVESVGRELYNPSQGSSSSATLLEGGAVSEEEADVCETRLEPLQFSKVPWDMSSLSQHQATVPKRVAGSSLPPPLRASQVVADPHHAAKEPSGSSSRNPGPKTIVFAPSPEKQRSWPASRLLSNQESRAAIGEASGNSSFARPTLASQARSRPVARASTGHSQSAADPPERPGTQRSYSYNITLGRSDPHHLDVTDRHSIETHGSRNASIRSTQSFDYTQHLPIPVSARRSSSSATRVASGSSSLLPPVLAFNRSVDSVATIPVTGSATRSFGLPTWSEMAQHDLVKNLGSRERTRQEVLWEIVASEERYVGELRNAQEFYIDALLRPTDIELHRSTPKHSLVARSPPILSSRTRYERKASASVSDLPIAARYMASSSKESSPSIGHDASRHASALDAAPSLVGARTHEKPTYGLGLGLSASPYVQRDNVGTANASATSLGTAVTSRDFRPHPRALSNKTALTLTVPLPTSLKEVLTSISDGLLDAHETLSSALTARYQDQWPLVRSLADIFMANSHMLAHYATYVCHLQRAMEELAEAALMARAFHGKKLGKERLSNTVGLGRTVTALETCAFEQGLPGLSIFISLPFQRLLKYPLLLQNLLYHTDPSTHEFESTVAMVVEVERLVRSIEDEKVTVEERDKTRDAFARIDGMTNKQLLRPKGDRMLLEERALYDVDALRADAGCKTSPEINYYSDSEGGAGAGRGASTLRASLRNKRSYRRLSNFFASEPTATSAAGPGSSKSPSIGSKKDLWTVRFSDVELRCQRIGVTSLPMAAGTTMLATDVDDDSEHNGTANLAARSKESRLRLKALRTNTLRAKTRNLYKFVAVTGWNSVSAGVEGSVQTDNGGRGGGGAVDGGYTSHEIEEEEEPTDDDHNGTYSSSSSSSDEGSRNTRADGVMPGGANSSYVRSTKLSFTYWGDRIEPNNSSGARRRASHAPATTSDDALPPHFIRSGTRHTSAHHHNLYHTASEVKSGPDVQRLNQPLAAMSMSTASDSMQKVVAHMHARPRNDKFGARLRDHPPTPVTASLTATARPDAATPTST